MRTTEVLERGSVEVLGRLPFSSNYAFLTKLLHEGKEEVAVYKPVRGERPLWDFPAGTLAAREVAAYLVSEALGWGLVPTTVFRDDGPAGAGSFQSFIPHDPERHFFVLIHEHHDRSVFERFAALDIVINNADRKGGHILEDEDGRLWGVDHGLSFNVEPKLRTVIWAFAGDALPPEVVSGLERLLAALDGADLPQALAPLLSGSEVAETRARAELLLGTARYPQPSGPFVTPWPLV